LSDINVTLNINATKFLNLWRINFF